MDPAIDRQSPRQRPRGWPVLHQRWHDLAFLHWPVAPAALRAVVPRSLEIDTHAGQAWVGIAPFSVSRLRPTLLPPVPGLSSADEVNVRVYVHRDGVPGIWFPSLDIDHRLAVWGARLTYRLPYHHARARLARHADGAVSFHGERGGPPPAALDVAWRPDPGPTPPPLQPGTLEFFLVERYVLFAPYAGRDGTPKVLRARIHHPPWSLRRATLLRCRGTLLDAAGIGVAGPPLVHAQTDPLDVAIWPPERLRG